jgi:hypothetical protein
MDERGFELASKMVDATYVRQGSDNHRSISAMIDSLLTHVSTPCMLPIVLPACVVQKKAETQTTLNSNLLEKNSCRGLE